MLGLGIPEMILILIVALLIFGPKKLPEIGRSVGSAMREFKKGVNDMKESFDNVLPEEQQPGFGQAAPASMGGGPAPAAQGAPDTPQAAPVVQAALSTQAPAAAEATVSSQGSAVTQTASAPEATASTPVKDAPKPQAQQAAADADKPSDPQ